MDLYKKLRSDSDIIYIICLSLYMTYNFLTYAQGIYSFVINTGLFVLCLFAKPGYVKRLKKLTAVWIAMILMLYVSVILSNNTETALVQFISRYMHYLYAPALAILTISSCRKESINIIVFITMVVIAISAFATLDVLIEDEFASRQLAGAATSKEQTKYFSQGVGGYGFIYLLVFAIYGLLRNITTTKSLVLKLAYILLTVLLIYTIIMSSYSTALLITLILVITFLCFAKKSDDALFIYVVLLCVVFLFRMNIFEFIKDLGKNLELSFVVDRMSQLIKAESGSSVESLKRYQLYKMSWDAFTNSMFYGGGGECGGHSQLLDALGTYGILGLSYIGYLIYSVLSTTKLIINKYDRIVFIIFIVFAAIDTIDSKELINGIFLLLPIMLSNTEQDAEFEALKEE